MCRRCQCGSRDAATTTDADYDKVLPPGRRWPPCRDTKSARRADTPPQTFFPSALLSPARTYNIELVGGHTEHHMRRGHCHSSTHGRKTPTIEGYALVHAHYAHLIRTAHAAGATPRHASNGRHRARRHRHTHGRVPIRRMSHTACDTWSHVRQHTGSADAARGYMARTRMPLFLSLPLSLSRSLLASVYSGT